MQHTARVTRFALAAALLAAGLGCAASAHAIGYAADIQIYDRTGNQRLPVYWHDGKAYVAGNPGNEYRISVANRGSADVLAVVSVDGVNVVSGETASPDQTGYVLTGWRSFDILGWRKSLSRTAAFYFTQLPDSYAARTGRPDNVGVIGVALFHRKPEPPAYPPAAIAPESRLQPYRDRMADQSASGAAQEAARSAPAAPMAQDAQGAGRLSSEIALPAPQPMEKSLGTGHGRSETSVVRNVDFDRATVQPEEVVTIYYDSLRNLMARGIIPSVPPGNPQPFPGRFVPDPRG